MGRKRTSTLAPQQAAQTLPVEGKPAGNIKQLLTHAAVAAGLCVLALLAWSNSFGGGFVFDSRFVILQDPRVHQATGENLGLILNHSYWWPTYESGLYRPITTLSYLFNYAILGNGDHPGGYHWINIFLHILNVLLVYALAFRLLRKLWPAIFVAAVWAVHPVLTESVTNIIGRADLLAGLALLSGLLMYLKSTESAGWHRMPWLAGLMAVTTIGVFSKESAVAILGVILLYELTWWKERKQLRGLLFGCAALAPPLLFMWYQRSVVMVTSTPPVLHFVDNPLVGASFIRGRLTAIVVMAKYLWLLVWPLRLSSDYSYNQIPIASGAPHDWIAWIAVLAVIIAAASMYKRSPAAFFFAGFAFVCFIPVSNLLFLLGTIMAERFLYLPAIGFAGCLVMVTYWIGRRIRWRPFAPIALCLIITIFAIRTWERNFDWRDNVTFWTAAVRTAPNSFKVYDDLAIVLNDSDPTHLNINQIIEEVEKSLAILDPLPDSQNTEFAYSNAGQYYATKGDLLQHQEANGQMTVTPGSLRAYQRSLEILLRGVAIDKALSESQRKEKLGSGKSESEIVPIGLPLLYESLAMTYFRLGDNQEAYDAAAFARLLSPQYVNAYAVMGEALFAENRKEDAAISLIEGSLATGDPNLLRLLQNAYNSGIDPKGCSFMQTGNGPLLNNSCEVVHKDICKASSELIRVLLQDQQLGFADDVKNKALVRFECSADELQPRTNQ